MTITEYRDAIRHIVADKRGPAGLDDAMREPYIVATVCHLHAHGAHVGYAAARVREYITTRHDHAVAIKHRAAALARLARDPRRARAKGRHDRPDGVCARARRRVARADRAADRRARRGAPASRGRDRCVAPDGRRVACRGYEADGGPGAAADRDGGGAMMETETQDAGSVSDGYHTFDELYEHRHALFIALMRAHPEMSWRANNHADGTSFEGWFIAGMHLPTGDVSYHLPVALWTACDHAGIATSPRAPEWDGHTSADVVERIMRFATTRT